MEVVTMSVGGHTYCLRQGADRARLEGEVVEAVRGGGNVVRIPTLDDDRVAVLFSPGLPVVFRTSEIEPEPDAAKETGPWARPFDEWDFDFK